MSYLTEEKFEEEFYYDNGSFNEFTRSKYKTLTSNYGLEEYSFKNARDYLNRYLDRDRRFKAKTTFRFNKAVDRWEIIDCSLVKYVIWYQFPDRSFESKERLTGYYITNRFYTLEDAILSYLKLTKATKKYENIVTENLKLLTEGLKDNNLKLENMGDIVLDSLIDKNIELDSNSQFELWDYLLKNS